ncbi:MAG: ATP-binding protein [Puniceicoccaceae bacterium]
MSYLSRRIVFPGQSFFLWGPRQSGKTTLLKSRYSDAHRIDLLRTDERMRYEREPHRLREVLRALPPEKRVVIDEIQKVPAILDEVHHAMQETGRFFTLCGSSARRIRRAHANLLGGRALKRELLGFSAVELGEAFDLERMLNHGPLPPHYLAGEAGELQAAYVDQYLKEEILDEGLTRNLPAFDQFLRAAAIGDTEVVNFSNIARESGVASSTIKGYYEVLEDTLVGAFLPAFTRRPKRRVQHAPKFFFRDVGVVNHLLRRQRVLPGSEIFGKGFENWIFHELSCYARTLRDPFEIAYWRLSSGIEVDFVLGDGEVAIEVKGKDRVRSHDTRHLLQFRKDYPAVRELLLVCCENEERVTDEGVSILPWRTFIDRLWSGDLPGAR